MRIHIHEAGGTVPVTHSDVSPETPLRAIIDIGLDERVYRVGSSEEIDLDQTVVEFFGSENGHVIRHQAREITIDVSYTGATAKLEVTPSTRVKTVLTEAIAALRIDPSSAVDLTLRVPGSDEDLDSTKPIGAYARKGHLAVDLVHIVRPQG